MRIFTTVRHSVDPSFYYGDLWANNFHPALERVGHEVVASRIDLLPASRHMHRAAPGEHQEAQRIRREISDRLVDEVTRVHGKGRIDLFLAYLYNSHCEPAAIRAIRDLGIPTVNFFCNSMYQFELVAEIAPAFDFSWHTEKAAATAYRAVAANPIWIQMAADPELYHPVLGAARNVRACFVGQYYCDRDRWLSALVRRGVPIDIYGGGWLSAPSRGADDEASGPRPGSAAAYVAVLRDNLKRHGWIRGGVRTVAQVVYAVRGRGLRARLRQHARGRAGNVSEVFSRYEVVLNFSNVWADGRPGSRLIPHVRLRDFEAPMCRTCYLTGHSDEIGEFYEIGREIDTYRSTGELVDKIQFYLRHPSAAEALREGGYRRVRRDHTWDRRFLELFDKIGLGASRAGSNSTGIRVGCSGG